jgi:tyrosine-protein kinase Etk/Wzc
VPGARVSKRPLGAIGESGCFGAKESQVNSEIYAALLSKTQELSISHAGTGGNVHIIDMALVSSQLAQVQDRVDHFRWRVARRDRGCGTCLCTSRIFCGCGRSERVERRFNLLIFSAIAFSAEQAPLDRPIALPSAQGTANGIKRLGTQQVSDGLGSTLGVSAKTPVAMALHNATVLPASRSRTQPLHSTTHPFDTSIEGLREFIHV